MAVKCTCGNLYNESYKFCPECAAPNPHYKNVENNNVQPPSSAKIVKKNSPTIQKEEYYEDDPPDNTTDPEEYNYAQEEYYEDDPPDNTTDSEEEYDYENVPAEDNIEENEAQSNYQGESPTATAAGKEYDLNYDGYYDDRLPLIVDELTKTSYRNLIFKGIISIAGVAAIIVYCLYFIHT